MHEFVRRILTCHRSVLRNEVKRNPKHVLLLTGKPGAHMITRGRQPVT